MKRIIPVLLVLAVGSAFADVNILSDNPDAIMANSQLVSTSASTGNVPQMNSANMPWNEQYPVPAWYAGTPYIQLQIGGGMMMDLDNIFTILGQETQGGLGWGVNIGYLMGQQHWNYGLEIGYKGYQGNRYNNSDFPSSLFPSVFLKLDGHLFDLLAVGRYNFNDHWNIFLKFGPALVFQKETLSGTIVDEPITSSQTAVLPELAGGFGYQLNTHVGFNLEANYAFGSDTQAQVGTVTTPSYPVVSVLNIVFGIQISL